MTDSGSPPPRRAKLALALAAVYLIWGSTYLAIRWMVADVPSFVGGGIRYGTAGIVFYVIGRTFGGQPATRAELRNVAIIGFCFLGVSNGLVGLASRRLPSSLTALILAVMPLWVALLQALRPRGVKPSSQATVGLVAGFIGTGILVWRTGGSQAAVDRAGVLMLTLAALVWAAASLFAQNAARPKSWPVSAGLEMMIGGGAQLLFAATRGDFARVIASPPGSRAVWALAYLIVIGSFGYGAFSWLVRNASPALAATYGYVNPLVAVTLGALLGGEALGPRIFLGGSVIVASVFLVSTARPRAVQSS